MIDQFWKEIFDANLRKFFGIDLSEAGLNDADLELYQDLAPREAALVYGEENDLARIDRGW